MNHFKLITPLPQPVSQRSPDDTAAPGRRCAGIWSGSAACSRVLAVDTAGAASRARGDGGGVRGDRVRTRGVHRSRRGDTERR